MIRESVRALLMRDLTAMIGEIEAYPDDGSVWDFDDAEAASLQARSIALAAQKRSFVLPLPD